MGHRFALQHLGALALLALTMGCADGGGDPCQVDGDCPPDHLCLNDQCEPLPQDASVLELRPTPDLSLREDVAPSEDVPAPEDLPPEDLAQDSGEDISLADVPQDTLVREDRPSVEICLPNDDGVLERSEMVFKVGLRASYLVNDPSDPLEVDLAGTMGGEGLTWDFTGTTASDHIEVVELLAIDGMWFAGDFPSATYATLLDAGMNTLAVFQATQTELLMLGIVSMEPHHTLLTYDPPIVALRFPLTEGDEWTSEGTSSGVMNWIPTRLNETYHYRVQGRGQVRVPASTFEALRVTVDFDQRVPFTVIHTWRKQVLFVAECFGYVALMQSGLYEQDTFFDQAEQAQRLSL